MTTKIVGGTILTPDGVLLGSVPVEIKLVLAQAFVVTGSYSMADKVTIQSSPAGTWQTPLECNDDLTPVGTLYQVTEKIPSQYGGSKTYLIQVLTGLGGGINQVANLVVPAAVPVGGTYVAIASGPTGLPGYLDHANNTALLAVSPKVEGQGNWVANTRCLWVWNGSFYQLINIPVFANGTDRINALNAISQHVSQPTYQQTNDVNEGPEWRNSNNSYTKPWNMPWGEIAYAEIIADSAALGAEADVTGLSLVFTHVNNRRIQLNSYGVLVSNTALDVTAVYITTGANVKLAYDAHEHRVANYAFGFNMSKRVVSTGSSQTFKIRAARVTGTGVATLHTLSGLVANYIQAVDIGPSGAPV